jgi:alanine dehydrogenase
VPLIPSQCRALLDRYPDLEILVQHSDSRCFTDKDYEVQGIPLAEDLSSCEVLLGVRGVATEAMIPGKTYLFFSHTAKKQPYNRSLLQAIISKKIRFIDYELLTGEDRVRVVALGRWAGVVGAYNALRAYGLRYNEYVLRPASKCKDLVELKWELGNVELGPVRFAVTGGGRAAGGSVEMLDAAGIRQVAPHTYLQQSFDTAVYTRLDPWHYTRRKYGTPFNFAHFLSRPGMYENTFLPYAARTDVLIASHYWDPRAPMILTREDLCRKDIKIAVIADVSCDIKGPIQSTIRASSFADPFYGYDPETGYETEPFERDSITVMAVDCLPGALPRDASTDFGGALMEHVIPELLGIKKTGMLERACIASDGALATNFKYLQDYLDEKGRSAWPGHIYNT